MARSCPALTDNLTSSSPFATGLPLTLACWVKPTSTGSNRAYMGIGVSGSAFNRHTLSLDFNGTNFVSAQTTGASATAESVTSAAITTGAWHLPSASWTSATSRNSYLDGASKGGSGSNQGPTGINHFRVSGRSDGSGGAVAGLIAHLMGWLRVLTDLEHATLGAGVHPRALACDYYCRLNQNASPETADVGSMSLTVTGTTFSNADMPVVGTWWTAAAQGNLSYTQGTPITAIDLATKFEDVSSAFTGSVRQLSAPGAATTANGAGSASNTLVVTSAAGFAANSYCSITNSTTPTLILAISGTTLLLATTRTWANGDSVYPIAHTAKTFTGLTFTGNSFGGTPAAGDVGSYTGLFFRATNNTTATLIADSAIFNMTVASSGAAASFTAGPTLTGPTTDGYAFSATSNQTATWWQAAFLKGSATPTATNIINGTGTGYVAHQSTALTLNVSGTNTLTGLTLPVYDVYHCLTNGNGNSAVVSFTDQLKAPPSGKQYVRAVMTPITAITKANPAAVTCVAHGRSTGDDVEIYGVSGMTQINNALTTLTKVDADHFTLDGIDSTGYSTYTSGGFATWGQSVANGSSTAVVTGDVFVCDAADQGGVPITLTAQGVPSLATVGDGSRRKAVFDAYSVSLGALIGSATDYVNNRVPIAPNSPNVIPAVFLPLNTAASVTIATLAVDPEGDTLTPTTSSSYPAGLSGALTGTPTVAAITTMTWTWTDAANETATGDLNIVTGNVTVPNLIGKTQSQIDSALAAVYLTANYGDQDDPNPAGPAALGLAIVQNPLANVAVAPNSVVNVTRSTGNAAPITPPVSPAVVERFSNQLVQELQPLNPLSPSYLSGAEPREVADVCGIGASDQPGSLYRFFKVPSNARIVTLEAISDANPNPTGSNYCIGVRQPYARGGALPTTARRDPIPLAAQILCSNITLDTERPRWTSVYEPSVVGLNPSKTNYVLRVWELLGLTADPNQIYEVVVTAKNPGTLGGNLALRMSYVR